MKRVKVLAFLSMAALVAALVLALMIPAATFAQQTPPHRFYGSAMVDGTAVADGTEVLATVVGTTPLQTFMGLTSGGNGTYVVTVNQPDGQAFTGKTVTFTVRAFPATQSATWEFGGASPLNLTAVSQQVATPTPPATPGVTVAPTPTRPAVTTAPTATVAAPRTPTVGPAVTQAPPATAVPGARGPEGPAGPAGSSTIAWIALAVGVVGLLTAAGAFVTGRTHSHIP